MANYINYRAYAVRYNASTHTFALYHEVHGLIADDLSIVCLLYTSPSPRD